MVQEEKIYLNNKTAVNIRRLASGIYFLQLYRNSSGADSEKAIRKFVKE